MKKIGMVLLLWITGVMLFGCSKADWYVIDSYQRKNMEASERYAPFKVRNIDNREELLKGFDFYLRNLIDFQEEDFNDINEEFFKEYNVLAFVLMLDKFEDVTIEGINIENNTLYVTTSISSNKHYFGDLFSEECTYFVAVKKSILDGIDEVELDIYDPFDNTKGSRYHIYE